MQIAIHDFFKPCYVKAIKNILKKVSTTKGVAGCDELQAIELQAEINAVFSIRILASLSEINSEYI